MFDINLWQADTTNICQSSINSNITYNVKIIMESLIYQPAANRNSPKSDRLVAVRSSQRLGPPDGMIIDIKRTTTKQQQQQQ